MDAARWQQIESLYRAARERSSAERSAYLAQACQGDEELRSEVETLLAQGSPESALDNAAGLGGTEQDRATLAGGDQVGPFRIVSLLGIGGMGKVYDAFDTRLDRHVALKVLSESTVAADSRGGFVREAKASASLNHPNIAQIHEIGEADGTCYIAMEYVEGETLRRKLDAVECPLFEILGYLRQTASAMERAHSSGVVHCDLKPDNIMVTQEGLVKVLDFGLARLVRRYKSEEPTRDHAPGIASNAEEPKAAVIGTLGYMSPEQALGKLWIDERSDVFSFGCLLFEAVTRHRPFAADSRKRTFHKLLHEPTPRISEWCQWAPPGMQRLIDRCLEKDPEKRFHSMTEVSLGLTDVLEEMGTVRTGGGISKTGKQWPELPRQGVRRRVWVVAAGILAIALVTAAYLRWYPRAATPSIAVIPFVNASGSPQNDYLSDGISESLIHALARWPDVRVISGSSSFRFKGKGDDVRSAARALGVQMLATGRVAELAGAFRISVELVNGADGTHIWGAMYNTQIAGLPGVETQIAREMAVRMRSKPTKTEEAKLSKGTSTHNEAYEFLLRGRYHMQLYSPESRQKAIGYYQQALALDPRFALANAEMARAYRVLSGSAVAAPSEAMTKAEAAASRALAADWELAEAHAALADIKKDQWDWAAAESEYRRALALNPNLAVAHQGYAIYLSVRGKGDAAIEEIQRAIEVDPLGLPTAIHAVAVYYNARHYDQSQQALKRAEGLDPTAPSLWTWMGMVHGANGRFKAAIEAYEKAIGLGDDTAATQCYYGYALARGGRRDQSLKIQEGLKTSGAYVSKVAVAILHAGLNQRERAIESLQEAFAARDPLLQYIRVEEHLDSIRDDRRFREIAAKVGLPE